MKSNDKPHNIVLMAPLPPPAGGIGRWAERYIELSKQYSIDVLLCNESVIGARKVFGKQSKINIWNEIKRTINIWKSLKKNICHFDKKCIVHCCIPAYKNSLRRELISMRIAKRNGAKFIVHFRSTIPNSIKTKKEIKLLQKMLVGCDYCIVLNKPSFDYASRFIDKAKIQIVPNFISLNELAKQKQISESLTKAIYVGGVVEEKGCDILLDVAEKRKDITFTLIGNPSSNIESIVQKKELSNVVLLGEQSSEVIRKKLDSSDLFIFLSRFSGEGFSNAVVEAMARGLPCITTDWASNKEQIGEMGSKYDLVIENNDLEKVLNALNTLSDKKVRKEVSEYNIDRVKECYSEEVVMKHYVSIYETLEEK